MSAVEDAELARFTLEEVAQHNSRASCWVGLSGQVYDFTDFLPSHPGGERGLLRHADATKELFRGARERGHIRMQLFSTTSQRPQ